jgi:hypothetical protein
MESLLDAIRIAASEGASDDERRRGLLACRALAFTLDGGLVVEAPPPTVERVNAELLSRPAPSTSTSGAAVAGNSPSPVVDPFASNPFVGLTADQILELAIAKLRAAVGDDAAQPPAGSPFRLTLVPVPRTP